MILILCLMAIAGGVGYLIGAQRVRDNYLEITNEEINKLDRKERELGSMYWLGQRHAIERLRRKLYGSRIY